MAYTMNTIVSYYTPYSYVRITAPSALQATLVMLNGLKPHAEKIIPEQTGFGTERSTTDQI